MILDEPITFAVASGLSPDVTAPPTPTGLAIALNGSNQPVLTWKASQDPLVSAGALWSGSGSYVIRRDGTLLTTVASATRGTPFALVPTQLGNPALSGSAVIAGSANGGLTINQSAAGAQWYGTADEAMVSLAPVTGDFFCCAKLTAFASQEDWQWAKFGITARASLNPNSATVTALYFTPADGNGVKLEYRATAGAVMQDGPLVPASGLPRWIGLRRVGDVFGCYHSTDGLVWILFANVTVVLGSAVLVGIGVCTEQPTNRTTVTVDGFNLSQLPDLIYTDTTAAPGTHSYTLTARDLAP